MYLHKIIIAIRSPFSDKTTFNLFIHVLFIYVLFAIDNIWVLTNWLLWKKLNGFVFFQNGCVFYKTALMKKFYLKKY